VEFALSTLLFLDPDRGVTLVFRKEESDVEKSSFWERVGVVLPS
jgi:hypothetical protein